MIDLLIATFFFSTFLLFFWGISRWAMDQSPSWKDLVKHFGTDIEPTKTTATNLKIRHFRLDGSEMTNVLKFHKTKEGLLIVKSKFIRGQSKNVLIPWTEIKGLRLRTDGWQSWVRLIVGDPFVLYIDIPKTALSRIGDSLEDLIIQK